MSKYAKKTNWVKPAMIVAYVLVFVISITATAVSQRTKYEAQIEDMQAIHEEEMRELRLELREECQTRIAEIEQYYEYGGNVSQIELEAEYIAKVIYGTARNHSDSDKKAVVWCILNRVEHYAHPNTISEVCEQPKQWMGYSNDNPVLDENYELALTELKIWNSGGHRPIDNDYIYLSWSSKEILLRNTFEENRDTKYWRMR